MNTNEDLTETATSSSKPENHETITADSGIGGGGSVMESERSEFTYTSLGGHVRSEDVDETVQSPTITSTIVPDVSTNGGDGHSDNTSEVSSNNGGETTTTTTTTTHQHQQEQKPIGFSQQNSVDISHQNGRGSISGGGGGSMVVAGSSLTFDELIDRLREDSIANKDVCNYILNLLVGGEFDLEKNFVIQNVTSILKMIQVIKCANASLKVLLHLN